MTAEERKKFDNFKNLLNTTPTARMSFFANVTGLEEPQQSNNPFERWERQSAFENKAICNHLGIDYKAEDFQVPDKRLAQEWAKGLPNID
ncbi:hypothetical protein IN666_14355 [Bacteroides fragilis]|uniref:hypothetical protein n=1 Tax=Bacteroides fragilis TaxID=817 RepID=UPI001879CA62|nr:hypothetical protein [Bacteroides fragilis]MBE7400669.1 hypothetical protein [Bacteroides fragilis]